MKYFSFNEFSNSPTAKKLGIDNTIPEGIKSNIKDLVDCLLDPLRESWEKYCKSNKLGNPAIIVTSGYRCTALNKAVKGKTTSAHLFGLAADIVPSNDYLEEFFSFVESWVKNKQFDQCIEEYSKWIHLSYKNIEGKQRKQIFKIG